MRWLIILLLLPGLVACGEPSSAAAAAKERRVKRQEAAEVQLGKTPVPRTYRYADGELRVLEVPVQDGAGFVDVQRCFLWRDSQLGTASLSCGQMPEILLTGPAP